MQAIIWSQQAWTEMKAETISNCWRKTGILPNVEEAETSEAAAAVARELEKVGTAVNELISSLKLGDDALQAAEYVELPGEAITNAMSTDEELIEIAQASFANLLSITSQSEHSISRQK